MLQLHCFTFNPFAENTYVIYNEKKSCIIVDPGMMPGQEQEAFTAFIECEGLVPKCILNTHAHIDHILSVDFVAKRYNIPFRLHKQDLAVLNAAKDTARMFGFDFPGVLTQPEFVSEHEQFFFEEDVLQLLFVPGHSPGSIALYCADQKWVISGDTLFAGSIGRTDLPGGNHNQLILSIKTQLLSLPGETRVYPGHGGDTDIATEIIQNPFLV